MSNRKGIIAFLLIAFGLAWILWEGVIPHGFASLNPIVKGVLMLPTGFAPAIAAFVVRKWITREGFADGKLRLNLKKWRYYAYRMAFACSRCWMHRHAGTAFRCR